MVEQKEEALANGDLNRTSSDELILMRRQRRNAVHFASIEEFLSTPSDPQRARQEQEASTGMPGLMPLQRSEAVPIPSRGRLATPPPEELLDESKPIGGELIGGRQLEPELMAIAESFDPMSQDDSFSPDVSSPDVSTRRSPSSTVSPSPPSPPPLKPKVKGAGRGKSYDPVFPYPDNIALYPLQRFYYIFSLVDTMKLQQEDQKRKKSGELPKKTATGAVPKTKNNPKEKENEKENLDWNLKKKTKPSNMTPSSPGKQLQMNPSSQAKPKKHYIMNMQEKPINLSTKTHFQQMLENNSKQPIVKRRQDLETEPLLDFDTECEFGMEYLELHRAKASRRDHGGNRKNRQNAGGPAFDSGEEYSSSSSIEEQTSKKNLFKKPKSKRNSIVVTATIHSEPRNSDDENQEKGDAGKSSGSSAGKEAGEDVLVPPPQAFPYDLRSNRNRRAALTPPSSDESNQASSKPKP
ncbi:nucleolar and coiled-body phosphoprotein 1-like [Drosophila guanche]|uniref:nucleolar and coiled-body phosphoprotein 1-like n=1 Tax=Drosophila guanche TaxID=7266 RepID=UPI0014726A5B|nr:nucleolar and coiled-body phosphoprotein 1-like [Drosophila guanche]